MKNSVCIRYMHQAAVTVCVTTAMAGLCYGQVSEFREAEYMKQREKMLTRDITSRGVRNADVLKAVRSVPRHRFVTEGLTGQAYADRPLPIGQGQTISQPYIVAYMTELLDVDQNDVVLEVGTGSGYQAAVLAELVKQVYTIEIVPELGARAEQVLKQQGYTNVLVKIGDGYQGWPDHAPFDGIIVTAAPDHIPEPLIEQLKPGGRMVIPVGPDGLVQHIMLVTKQEYGAVHRKKMLPVRFVPLTGKEGGRDE